MSLQTSATQNKRSSRQVVTLPIIHFTDLHIWNTLPRFRVTSSLRYLARSIWHDSVSVRLFWLPHTAWNVLRWFQQQPVNFYHKVTLQRWIPAMIFMYWLGCGLISSQGHYLSTVWIRRRSPPQGNSRLAKLHAVPEINLNMLDAQFVRHCAKELPRDLLKRFPFVEVQIPTVLLSLQFILPYQLQFRKYHSRNVTWKYLCKVLKTTQLASYMCLLAHLEK
jgi:hypothetical protein